jgi:trimeric autotransporter adhesin
MTTLPTTARTDAINLTTDLAQAGTVYNDATRLLDGGLWNTPADANNQPAFLGMYTTDITAVLDDVTAALANPNGVTVSGNAFTLADADTAVLQQVQGQLQTLLTQAPLSIGTGADAAAAQQMLHTTQMDILNEINGDAALATALGANPFPTGTGANNVGFQALPAGSDAADALAAATAPNATLAQIGTVYNAAADLAIGGLNQNNLTQFNTDMQAISTGLTNLVNNPTALAAIEAGEAPADAALTTLHLQTVLGQINLQINDFDAKYATDPNAAARSTNDNLLDMIDIVQNDAALNMAAGGNGTPASVGGFAEMPAYLDNGNGMPGTITQFQDDQPQTNFWAQFLAEANVINNQLTNVAAGNNATAMELASLITEIQNYQQFGASFDQAQGGTFGARFDNELLGGTLQADTNAAVHGLTGIMNGDTGAALAADQAEITAAGSGFAADAMDVSGNNIPIGGGAYVGTATTVAGATSVAGVAQGTIPVGPVASATTGLSSDSNAGQAAQGGQTAQGGQPAAPAGAGQGAQVADAGNPADHTGAADHTNSADHGNPADLAMMDHSIGHMPNQFELMWHHV